MARLRTIKPGFFTNDDLGECQPLARLLFAGLWCQADRTGRLEDRPKRLKVEVLPYDDCNIESLLGELVAHGFIVRYAVAGTRYMAIPTWHRHQNPHIKETESIIPAPPSTGKNGALPSSIEGKHHASTVQAPDEHSSSRAVVVLGSCLGSGESPSPTEKGAPDADAPDATPPTQPVPVLVPVPKPSRGNDKVAAVIDALKAEGMTGVLTPKDRKAITSTEHDPRQVAALYAAIYHGEHGDDYMLKNLSVWLCLEKMPGWLSVQAGNRAPPAVRNGKYSRAAAVSDAIEDFGEGMHHAGYDRGAQGRVSAVRGELPRLSAR